MYWIRRHRRGRPPHPDVLTPAEWRVLELVREGMPNAEIAVRLGITVRTVKGHVSSILAKTGMPDRHAVAEWDGQPAEVSRATLGRGFGLSATGWFTRGGASLTAKVSLGVAASAVFVVGLISVYAFFGAAPDPTEPSPSSPAISTPSSTPATVQADETPVPLPAPGEFAPVGPPGIARTSPSALRIPDGRVLVAGGGTVSPASVLDSAEVFDPATGHFEDVGPLTEPRTHHAATLLSDGRVLITGGVGPGYTNQPLGSAEVYDPQTGAFSAVGSMHVPRWSPGIAQLPDGRVLVAGGGSGVDPDTRAARAEATAEIFDPTTGRFELTGQMHHPRIGVTLTTLDDGRVLVSGDGPLEIYDPESDSFLSLTDEPLGLRPTATLLADGRVLFTGGNDREQLQAGPPESHGGGPATREISVFDPVTERLTPAGEMLWPRASHAAVRLVDGRVLISGGAQDAHHDEPLLAETEIFDPATGESVPTGSMLQFRFSHRLVLLEDGTVLVVGVSSSPATPAAERYGPPSS